MIKTLKRFAAIASATLALPVLALAPIANAATTVVVSQSNLQGWESTTRPGGAYSFVTDVTSPLPNGALQLNTDSDANAYIKLQKSQKISLSTVNNLKYSTRQVSATDAMNGNASFRINLDLDGGNIVDEQLIFEPYYNGFSGGTNWREYDLLAGKYWSNIAGNTYNGSLNCGGCAGTYASNFTLSDVLHDYPDAKVLAISVSMGTDNLSQNVLVDNVQLNDTTYNFEVTQPLVTITNKEQCKNNGWMASATTNFKNQGDCVSSFASKGKANGNPVHANNPKF